MAEGTWQELYDEAKTGKVSAIPEGPYDVTVTSVRALAKSRLLFLDLQVNTGPSAGKVAQVNLYLPEPGQRGAGFHFRNKILGFGDLSETFKQMDSAADVEGALNILADALTGRRVNADIELRSDGEYAGTNQLAKTKPVGDAMVPNPTKADNGVGPEPENVTVEQAETDEVAALKAQLAAAEAATNGKEAVAAATSGEVPF